MKTKNKNKKKKSSLLELAGEKRSKLILSAILSIIGAIMSLVPFLVVYLIALELFNPPIQEALVWQLGFIALFSVIIRFVLMGIASILSHISAYDILYDLRSRFILHIGTLPMGFFNRRNSGTLKKIVTEDVERIELFIAHHIPDLAAAIALPLLTISIFFIMDWRLAIAAVIPLPLAFIAQKLMYGDLSNLMKKYNDSLEDMNGTIVEYVRAMPVIKVFNQTVQKFARYQDSVNSYTDFESKWQKKYTPSWAGFNVIIGSSLFFIAPVGLWLFLGGQVSISVLLLFLILGVGFTSPLYQLLMFGALLRRLKEGLDRINIVLEEPEISVPRITKTPENYSIEFRNVNFSYDHIKVLHNVNFIAQENSLTALVGPSGAGKTTIAQLIARFWDIQDGEILIGGVNIKDIPIEFLNTKVAFVFQDIFLFNDTIYENLRMGNEEITEEQIIIAAKAAQAHEFIQALPKGYQTNIGEGGARLSGGERQRLSIARAILKDAPIIILDEATTFADAENEAKIKEAVGQLMQGKTAIVIGHRLSTITDADQIIVIDTGNIVEKGKHEELLSSNQLYKNMWETHTAALDWTFEIGGGQL